MLRLQQQGRFAVAADGRLCVQLPGRHRAAARHHRLQGPCNGQHRGARQQQGGHQGQAHAQPNAALDGVNVGLRLGDRGIQTRALQAFQGRQGAAVIVQDGAKLIQQVVASAAFVALVQLLDEVFLGLHVIFALGQNIAQQGVAFSVRHLGLQLFHDLANALARGVNLLLEGLVVLHLFDDEHVAQRLGDDVAVLIDFTEHDHVGHVLGADLVEAAGNGAAFDQGNRPLQANEQDDQGKAQGEPGGNFHGENLLVGGIGAVRIHAKPVGWAEAGL